MRETQDSHCGFDLFAFHIVYPSDFAVIAILGCSFLLSMDKMYPFCFDFKAATLSLRIMKPEDESASCACLI